MSSDWDASNDARRPDAEEFGLPADQAMTSASCRQIAEDLGQRFRQAGEGAEVAVLRQVLLAYLTRGAS